MESSVQIIILAGGQGKRMGGEVPKVLTLFNGRPIIEYSLDAAAELELPLRPVVVVGFGAEMVKERLGDRVEYALQAEQLGTGHAVLCARDIVAGKFENVIVLYGDHPNIKAETIRRLLALHAAENPAITMMTLAVPDFLGVYSLFRGFGKIVRGADGKILKNVEVKDANDEEKNIRELNPSLYCFNAPWLWENLPKVGNKNKSGEYYLTDMVGLAIQQGQKIASLEIDYRECIGVNTPEELRIAGEIIMGEPQ